MATGRNIQGRPHLPENEKRIIVDEVLGKEEFLWKINFDARKPPGPVTIDIAARIKEAAPNPAETEPPRGTSLMNTLVGVNWSPRMWIGVCVVVIIIVVMIAPKKKEPVEQPQTTQYVQQPKQQPSTQKGHNKQPKPPLGVPPVWPGSKQ